MYTLTSLLEGVANPFLPAGASSPACYPLPSLPPALTATMWRLSAAAGDVVLKTNRTRGLGGRGFKPACRTPIVRQGRWRALSNAPGSTGLAAPGGGPCRTPSVRQASVSNAAFVDCPSFDRCPIELHPFDRDLLSRFSPVGHYFCDFP